MLGRTRNGMQECRADEGCAAGEVSMLQKKKKGEEREREEENEDDEKREHRLSDSGAREVGGESQ